MSESKTYVFGENGTSQGGGFYGSSITEEKQMAQFIKDYVDDEDQQDGFIFNRFYADTSFNGIGIPWEEIL